MKKKGCGEKAKGRYRGDDYAYTCDEYHLCDECYKSSDKEDEK